MGYQKKYKKFVATAATATLVASAIVPVASAKSFSDVAENNEFQPFIDALSDAGIINGYQDGTFKPGNKLTRGQVVKMLGRWVEANGQEIPADWNSVQRFNDVPTNSADEELVKYAALVKDAGVFTGSNGNLMAGNNITRQQMAKVLNGAYTAINGFSLVDLADSIDNKLVTDLASAQQEFEGYIQALVDLEISTVSVFRPTENVTRAQFAKFLYNTINLEVVDAVGVKAINNTTVEVTFEDKIDNVKDLDFKIEGLEVKNAVVKQTDAKTAVLTTSAQEGGKEYTVSVDGEKVGTFKGIAAVIPTKITTTTTSLQGVIGEQVTVKAQVAVAEGQSKENIPVTFNVVNNNSNVNGKIEVEVLTNAEGVATYSYTRYYGSEDTVTVYATQKSSIYDDAKVYWDKKVQLAVSEITTGNELANETKKSYKVTGEKNKTYYVAIKENLNVAPDKIVQVKVQNGSDFTTPYELTTDKNNFATVTTNSNGEATFTVYGSNLSATPIVYSPETTPIKNKVNNTVATTDEEKEYNKLDLQAQAPTVKFSQINRLALTVKAEGTAEAAQYAQDPKAYDANSVGGRTYTVTVTDKDGKLASEGTTAYVTFEKDNISGDVYFSTGKKDFVKVGVDSVQAITVGKDGKAQFRVAGKGATAYAKPTVFLNTTGDVNPAKLDKTGSTTDIYQVADVTYFKAADVKNAVLKVTDAKDKEITSATAGTDVYVKYQSVDQNGFAYKPTSTNYQLVFDVTSTFGNVDVKDEDGKVLNSVQNLGNTKTYKVNAKQNGEAVIRVTSTAGDDVTVNVTGSNGILPTKTAKVSFTSTSTVSVATGVVVSKNEDTKKIVIENSVAGAAYTYSYATADVAQYQVNGAQVDEDAFKALLSTGDTVTAVQAADGKYILNLKDGATATATAITSQAGFNQALANGEKAFNLAITGGLLINTTETTTLTLNGTITGDVTVNAPNAHIVNNATINGNVKILDVAGSSFVNNGTIAGTVTITDSNAKFENKGTFTGQINIVGTGKQTITLLGTESNNVVVGANVTDLALGTGSVYGSIVADNKGTNVTVGGTSVSPGVVAGKGVENATITSTKTDTQVTINIKDADLNKSATVAETFAVEADYAGEKITLKFAETGVNTGEFAAVVNITKTGDLKLTYVDNTTLDGLALTINRVDSLITKADADAKAKELADAIAAVYAGTATDEQVNLVIEDKGTKKASGNIFAHASSTVLGIDEANALVGNPAKVALGSETDGQILVTKPFDEFTPQASNGGKGEDANAVWIGALVKAPENATKATYIYTAAGSTEKTSKSVDLEAIAGTYIHVVKDSTSVDESKNVRGFIQYLNLAKASAGFSSDFTVVWFDADGNVVGEVETFTFKYAPKAVSEVK